MMGGPPMRNHYEHAKVPPPKGMKDIPPQERANYGKSVNALKEWVESGGMLLLGTGANADKVLKGFSGNINFN